MTETPNPTGAEILADMSQHTGRISLAQRECIRRLRALLPLAIAAHNQAEGTAPGKGVIPVSGVEKKPAELAETFLNKIVVGVSVETVDYGSGAFQNVVELVIYSIDQKIEQGRQVDVSWERCELVRGCLYPFLSGCVDADGRRVWRSLVPRAYSQIEGTWAKGFSGTEAHFQLIQAAAEDGLWG